MLAGLDFRPLDLLAQLPSLSIATASPPELLGALFTFSPFEFRATNLSESWESGSG